MKSEQYFAQQPQVASQPREIRATLRGEPWRFVTDRGVFSPDAVDAGSRLLIETMIIPPGSRLLDLGAGYGPIGLVAARLAGPGGQAVLVEINERALALAEQNAVLNGVENVSFAAVIEPGPPFDVVLTNPPSRAGYKVVMPLLEAGAEALAPGGALWLVGHKHLGVKTLAKRLEALLGPVETMERKGGYRVLRACREAADG